MCEVLWHKWLVGGSNIVPRVAQSEASPKPGSIMQFFAADVGDGARTNNTRPACTLCCNNERFYIHELGLRVLLPDRPDMAQRFWESCTLDVLVGQQSHLEVPAYWFQQGMRGHGTGFYRLQQPITVSERMNFKIWARLSDQGLVSFLEGLQRDAEALDGTALWEASITVILDGARNFMWE